MSRRGRGRYEVMCLGEVISTHRTLRAAQRAAARYQPLKRRKSWLQQRHGYPGQGGI